MRVRHHENIARIEEEAQDLSKITQSAIHQQIVDRLKSLGFTYVTLDLQGYRTGSLNEEIE